MNKRSSILMFIILLLSGCMSAQQKEESLQVNNNQESITMKEIIAAYETGNYSQAEALILKLNGQRPLSAEEKWEIHKLEEMMKRIRIDFSKNLADHLPHIKKYFPNVSDAQIADWEKANQLEMMRIDGEKKYFRYGQYNLFRLNKEAKACKIEVDGISDDSLNETLKKHIPEVISAAVESKQTLVKPVRMRLNYTLTVDADAVPEGEVLRCWLPYPRNDQERQMDIKLLEHSENNAVLSPENYAHKTIYMEKSAEAGKATVFELAFEYTAMAEYHNLEKATILPYQKDSELYQRYTREETHHIIFTDRIKAVSEKVVGDTKEPLEIAKKVFQWINDKYPWASAREYSTIPNIPEYVLENNKGDCGQVTLLFLTLMRYNGIPARWQSGWMMHPGDVNLHDWGEIYFAGIGWVPVDMSFGMRKSENEAVKWFYLGGIDSYRLIVNSDYG
ncbi:MAG TPA: transglutaminase domain-containing protein, partial [Candidatus Marinimicrobia bacterium]|nr:transglutaminase domain-containing protein [Candidatus Neomarinimicrobiota bacterium]